MMSFVLTKCETCWFLQFEACEAELESLKEEEKLDRELIGFGTAGHSGGVPQLSVHVIWKHMETI